MSFFKEIKEQRQQKKEAKKQELRKKNAELRRTRKRSAERLGANDGYWCWGIQQSQSNRYKSLFW